MCVFFVVPLISDGLNETVILFHVLSFYFIFYCGIVKIKCIEPLLK